MFVMNLENRHYWFTLLSKCWCCHISYVLIQGVPLATEPDISLIIQTPMKILQRNLNRSTFVVWEMKRNVSVVCVCSAPNCCDTGRRPASQPARLFPAWRASLLISLSFGWGCLHNTSTCYDVVTFLTQWGESASNFVAISSSVVKLLKKCRVR